MQKDCGEKPYQTGQMGGKSQMARMYQTEDSKLLKESADKLVDKFLIIGMNILDAKKFKKQANK